MIGAAGPRRRISPPPSASSVAPSDLRLWWSHQRAAPPSVRTPGDSSSNTYTATIGRCRARAACSAGWSPTRRSSRNQTTEGPTCSLDSAGVWGSEVMGSPRENSSVYPAADETNSEVERFVAPASAEVRPTEPHVETSVYLRKIELNGVNLCAYRPNRRHLRKNSIPHSGGWSRTDKFVCPI